jgi:6-phosphogluconolactonase (cycloisomerase 2 family)
VTAGGRLPADGKRLTTPIGKKARQLGAPLGEQMSKKTGGVVALVALCGLSLFLLNCGNTVSRSSGLLYVLSQGSSNVQSYAINLSSGGLSLINSNASTCTTQPCGLPLNIILDPTGATAFVLNQGVFTPLDPTQTPPVPQTGSVPSIYGYTVNSDGSLAVKGDMSPNAAPPAPSQCDQPPPAQPAQGVFWRCDIAIAMTRDAGGKFLFVITGGNQNVSPPSPGLPPPNLPPHLYVFITQTGSTALTLASQLTLSRIPTAIATIAGPNSTVLMYVTSNKDLSSTNDNTVSEYSVDTSGNVTEQVGSPYTTASNPSAVVAASTSPIGGAGGLFVYVTNLTTHSVSVYQVCTVQTAACTQQNVTDLTLLPVGTPSTVGSNPVAMVVDPKSNFLFVASENSNQVFGFRINAAQGTLSALSPANVSTGLSPIALAMHSSGKFLFVSNNASSNISGFNLDTTSGAMSSPITVTSSADPAGLVSK